ncbi:hypothetical protein ACKKBG_A14680 [Auxenochlorella protothecoides x Auxenochlorella symbiontica]
MRKSYCGAPIAGSTFAHPCKDAAATRPPGENGPSIFAPPSFLFEVLEGGGNSPEWQGSVLAGAAERVGALDSEDEEAGGRHVGSHPRLRSTRRSVDRYQAEDFRAATPFWRRLQNKPAQARSSSDSDFESPRRGPPAPPSHHFAERYSVRVRAGVERYEAVATPSTGPGQAAGARDPGAQSPVVRASSPRGDGGAEPVEQSGEPERRTYPFRDRTLVTINRTAEDQQVPRPGSGSGRRPARRHKRGAVGGPGMGGHERHRRGVEDAEDVLGTVDLPQRLAARPGGLPEDPPDRPFPGAWGAPRPADTPLDLATSAARRSGPGPLGAGLSGAEIAPIQVDPSVSFDSVGGLDGYLRLLKEMVFLPLVYPDLFQRFHIAPPRGVLFHGPPGTGKTLVARALASHAAASSGRRVAFFMRKGADILSKWVGEAERQLRALFDEARRHQPSIIFFDEIDGLAPVRSSKQDQIHNSIVSTLLALMDGLDARGQVVVIGATNRVDAVDGALRRPGRFDRELLFPLPALEARAEILGIHTRRWAEPPPAALLAELAAETVGYGGADLKALCTEASLAALRRRYPQVYDTQDRLVLDLQAVRVERADFQAALRGLTPASHRAAVEAVARPLPAHLAPLLRAQLDAARASVAALFPPFVRRAPGAGPSGAGPPGAGPPGAGPPSAPPLPMPRPRVLLCGAPRCGQGVLARALLHGAEGLALCALGLPALLADPGARGVEEALVRGLAEARRGAPAVLHLPHADAWWACAGGLARAALTHLLDDLGGGEAVLLLASAEAGWEDLDPGLAELFAGAGCVRVELGPAGRAARRAFFRGLAEALAREPQARCAAPGPAPVPPPLRRDPAALEAAQRARREREGAAARARYESDQATLRGLRMVLRDVTTRALSSRRWQAFAEPVTAEEDPDYAARVPRPMDLSTLLARVDAGRYATPGRYLADVALLPDAERAYWGDSPRGARAVSRACALEDELREALAAALAARSDLCAGLEAIAEAGGPAPAPPLGQGGRRIDVEVKEDEGPEERAPTSRRSTRLTTTPGTGDASLEAIHQDPEAARRAIRQRLRQEEADRRAGADVLGKQGGAASPMQPLETPGPAQPLGAEGTDAAPPQDLVQQCDDAAYDPPVSPRRAAVAEKATARLAKLARGAPLQSLEEALAIGWQVLPRIQTLPLEKRTRAMLRALRPALHGED